MRDDEMWCTAERELIICRPVFVILNEANSNRSARDRTKTTQLKIGR
jgi:hypothetical protein